MIKITIIYDNLTLRKDLIGDWGFSCLVEAHGKKILFDTGAQGPILLHNMARLDIAPEDVDEVFISHPHFDHTGGLSDFLRCRQVKVYVPACLMVPLNGVSFFSIKDPVEILTNIFSTGQLGGFEQSLIVRCGDGVAVIVGCSHPDIGTILHRAAEVGKVTALIGGLHGFSEFALLQDIETVCPTHCSVHAGKIKTLFPEKTIEGGAGRIIILGE